MSVFLERAARHHGEGRFEEAARLYGHVHALNPDVLAAPYFLALIDIETGWLTRALDRLRHVARRDPSSFEPTFALGYTFQELGWWRQAVDAYRRALALKPDSTSARFALAHALEVDGRLDEAAALYRELAANDTTRLMALVGLSLLRPGALAAAERTEMETAAADLDTPVGVRTGLLFALGEALEAARLDDDAFAAFREGNRLRRAELVDPDPKPPAVAVAPPGSRPHFAHPDAVAAGHAAHIEREAALFTPAFVARHAGGGRPEAPIFVVGMPRSGSTLIEQILSSHGKVQGLGESPALAGAIAGHLTWAADPAPADAVAERIRAAAAAYLDRQRAFGWDGRSVLVDKMLGNYTSVGMIHLMFPNARILHSVRDPVETCLGCFRKLFRSGNETTYDLADIGAHYRRYRNMMDHWERVLPGRVIPVVHEALLADPEAGIRRLVEGACGLKWDPACLTFHRSRRPVRTASVAQVRQPISTAALQRWRRYEAHLGPLFEALGTYAPAARAERIGAADRIDASGGASNRSAAPT